MSEKNNYISQLTFPRFIAAMVVVLHHYCNKFFPFNTSYLSNFIDQGGIAVSFFFFLSGVVLSVSYWDKGVSSAKDFWLKRFARIYPVYFLGFIMVVGFSLIGGSPIDFVSAVYQALVLHAWNPSYTLDINYPSWSISVEMLFYFSFPFLIGYFKKRSISHLVGVTAVLYILGIVQYLYMKEWHQLFRDGFPVWHLNTFVFGILGGVLIVNLRSKNLNYKIDPLWWWVAGSLAIYFILNTRNVIQDNCHNGTLSPIFLLICVGLALDKSVVSKWLSAKPLVYLGNASYAMYILQFPALMLFVKLMGVKEISSSNYLLYLGFLIIVSCLTYTIYEKKGRDIILKITSKKKS